MTPPSEIAVLRDTASSTRIVILHKNPNGRGGTIKNLSYLSGETATTVYIGGSGVTVANGYPLDPGESINTQSNAAVHAICNGADTCKMASFSDRAAATVAT